MSKAPDIVVQLSAEWRIIAVLAVGWNRRAWSLECRAGDGWQGRGMTRSADQLRRFVQAFAGRVDADAAAVLAQLPPCFRSPPLPRKRRARVLQVTLPLRQ